ncbi:3-deoxy-manno-octulosonate-8-phosphatase KdsC [Aliiglaciecola sp. CAU 1673]|uniref:3-deoxy-manno-octulosonate-8-phosphatase KdsC n=1 Tax=Aliiglaciecola sp. CAU 1673 TaxID=3032595 RepID=UPI0023DB0739|nr:3-deoxy-manno-octulosonate-8-phosphatase KdsC [Aliiglaciecola sp. CAU 1673]MDF2178472.1 3-deoxy-manno-octulosonate-8-phosphatase KdsC [Aliiglaciecola sp. CAU 1673]
MNSIQTMYGPVPQSVFEKLATAKLLVCDVDGIFSDGRIYLGNDGEEYKAFHTRDGYGVKALLKNGIQVAVITGRQSNIVQQRMSALGIAHIIQGTEHKKEAMHRLLQELSITSEEAVAMGDDMPDLGLYELAGVKVCIPDGHPFMQEKADYVTRCQGGFGAVREICDLILQANGLLSGIQSSSV